TVVRNHEIHEAVVVDVSGGAPLAVAVLAEPGLFRNVFECAIAAVTVQPIEEILVIEVYWDAAALSKVQVRPAIRVVVQHRDASPHALDQVLESRLAVEVLEIDPECLVDIAQRDARPTRRVA